MAGAALDIARLGRPLSAHAVIERDQLAAFGDVTGGEQSGDRHRDKGRIGEIASAIGEGEPARFGDEMQRAQVVGLILGELERLEQRQDLQDGDAAGRRRRHAADQPDAIRSAQRLTLDRLVGCEIGQRQGARPHMAVHARHHLLRQRAVIESLRTVVGDQSHCVGQGRIDRAFALLLGRAVDIEIDRPRRGLVGERLDDAKPEGEARGHRKAIARQGDRRLEQLAPRPLAMFLVRQFEQSNRARNADRYARGDGLAERQRLAVGAEEHGGRRPCRRGLAPVIGGDRLARGVVIEQEPAAPQARRMRLDHAQHHLHRHGGVDCRAAVAQHRQPCLGRQRMGGRHHLARCRLRRAGAEQRDSKQQDEPLHARRATMNRRRKGKSVMPSARVG